MLIDCNRGLIITDDTLNVTYIKENKKGAKEYEEEELENMMSPHFASILEIHDYYRRKKLDLKEKKKKNS